MPLGAFSSVLERLRGTAVRATEVVSGVAEDLLSRRANGRWSAKENLGHLVDLQQLDDQRLWDFLSGAQVLSAADPENRMTEDGGHNQIPVRVLVERLRTGRLEWVRKLEALGEDEAAVRRSTRVCSNPCACWTGCIL